MTVLTIDQIPTQRHDLKLLQNNLYAFEIKLSGLSKSISISWNKLGLSPESITLLKQSGVKLKGITLFSQLDTVAKQLKSKREDIELRTHKINNQRVVTESQINAALEEYAELKDLADSLRDELRQRYQTGYLEFRNRMQYLVQTPEFGIPYEEQSLKHEEICNAYQNEINIDSLLHTELEIYRIPSLKQQMKEQQDLANELALLKQAKNQVRAQEILAETQEHMAAKATALRTEIFANTRAEIEKIIAEQIKSIAKFESEAPNSGRQATIDAHYTRNAKVRAKLKNHLKRLSVLAEINADQTVEKYLNTLTRIDSEINRTSGQSTIDIKEALATLKNQLEAKTESMQPSKIQYLSLQNEEL